MLIRCVAKLGEDDYFFPINLYLTLRSCRSCIINSIKMVLTLFQFTKLGTSYRGNKMEILGKQYRTLLKLSR